MDSFRTLIYYEKNYGFYGGKIWYYGKNYDIIPKTMKLWFTMEKNYGTMEKKNYGTIVKSMYFFFVMVTASFVAPFFNRL